MVSKKRIIKGKARFSTQGMETGKVRISTQGMETRFVGCFCLSLFKNPPFEVRRTFFNFRFYIFRFYGTTNNNINNNKNLQVVPVVIYPNAEVQKDIII